MFSGLKTVVRNNRKIFILSFQFFEKCKIKNSLRSEQKTNNNCI